MSRVVMQLPFHLYHEPTEIIDILLSHTMRTSLQWQSIGPRSVDVIRCPSFDDSWRVVADGVKPPGVHSWGEGSWLSLGLALKDGFASIIAYCWLFDLDITHYNL